MTLIPLTGVRADAYDLWQGYFDWHDTPETAADIVTGDEATLERLCNYDTDQFDDDTTMESWAALFSGIDATNTVAFDVAVEMLPDWPGEVSDLITAAVELAA